MGFCRSGVPPTFFYAPPLVLRFMGSVLPPFALYPFEQISPLKGGKTCLPRPGPFGRVRGSWSALSPIQPQIWAYRPSADSPSLVLKTDLRSASIQALPYPSRSHRGDLPVPTSFYPAPANSSYGFILFILTGPLRLLEWHTIPGEL